MGKSQKNTEKFDENNVNTYNLSINTMQILMTVILLFVLGGSLNTYQGAIHSAYAARESKLFEESKKRKQTN